MSYAFRVRRLCISLGLVLTWANPARAEPTLQWTTPAGADCPKRAAIVHSVERHLGTSLADHPDTVAVVTAKPSRQGWRVRMHITVNGTGGERELTATTCAEAGDAAAFLIAMAIDPEAVANAVTPAAKESSVTNLAFIASGSSSAAARDTEPIPEVKAAIAITPAVPMLWDLRGSVISDLGVLPGLVPGVGLTVGLRRGAWRAELTAGYWFERDKQLEDSDAGGAMSLTMVAARGCRATGVAATWACVGGEFGRMRGRGFGVEQTFDRSSDWWAATANVGRSWNMSKLLGVYLAAEVALPLERPQFKLEERLVHQPSAVAGRVVAGAVLEFQ